MHQQGYVQERCSVFNQQMKPKGFSKECWYTQHTENVCNYVEFGGTARNLGVISLFSMNPGKGVWGNTEDAEICISNVVQFSRTKFTIKNKQTPEENRLQTVNCGEETRTQVLVEILVL